MIRQSDIEHHRAHAILPEGARLTRYTQAPITISGATFTFDYRRDAFDFELARSKLCFLGLPQTEEGEHQKVFLTNSGQAAINACYFYIDKILRLNAVESHNDYLYVGAYRLQSLYQVYHRKEPSPCLWICSTATRFEEALKLQGEWSTVIVDTTCWAVGSQELQSIYDKFYSHGLLIFFRSHSKLDMGGVEYGSLGNLTVFSKDRGLLEKACFHFREILGLTGGYASLDEIPPYLFEEEFYRKSRERVQKIVDNTLLLKSRLESTGGVGYGELIFPDHHKYFFIRLRKDVDEATCQALVRKTNFLLGLYLPTAKACASFGFNFPSVTFYRADEGSGHFFRFSTGVISPEEVEKLQLCIQEIFGR